MTVQDVIRASMRKLAVVASGETVPSAELIDGLQTLQTMLRSWAGKKINSYATVQESAILIPGQASYSWGSEASDIITTRPYEIVNAFLSDGTNDNMLRAISKNQYDAINFKYGQGMPECYYYFPTYPDGTLCLYPAPDKGYTIYFNTIKPFDEIDSFDNLGATFSFPPPYEEAVIYNLAVRLAPEYGKPIVAEIAAVAQASYETIMNLNANSQVEPIFAMLPVGYRWNVLGLGGMGETPLDDRYITSTPNGGEYKVVDIRLGGAGDVKIKYNSTPEP